jgi:ABC-2 type transport system permease protein
MKLLSSLKKELILATRSFYFYIELLLAAVILAVVMFAIPEHAETMQTRYIYLDMPEQSAAYVTSLMLEEDSDGAAEEAAVEEGSETFNALLIETGEEKLYLVESEYAVKKLADKKQNIGAVVSLGKDNELQYKYYLQGYESERLRNLISVALSGDSQELEQKFNEQQVKVLKSDYEPLNDRENAVPPLLAFNSSLMGMFIMAAYVFLDKKEGVINAYAVTASSVARYLLSKAFVIMLTAVVSGLIVVMPVMGFGVNYGLLLLLLITSGFFGSVAGLLIASFYKDIAKAFAAIFILLILMMVPSIAYFLPSWNPVWVNFIPSDPIIKGFKEIFMQGGDKVYALLASAGFLAGGVLLFLLTNWRFKKTLSI